MMIPLTEHGWARQVSVLIWRVLLRESTTYIPRIYKFLYWDFVQSWTIHFHKNFLISIWWVGGGGEFFVIVF